MKLFFLHIPKAGGSTIHTIVQRAFKESEILTLTPSKHRPGGDTPAYYLSAVAERFNSLSPHALKKIKLIKGHFYFGLHEALDEPAKYFTFIRDPIERVVSSYYFIRYRPTNAHSQQASELGLKDFIARGYFINNMQTKMIYGPNWPGKTDDELLEGAKRNIENHFLFVGLVEQFDKSLILLNLATKIRLTVYRKQNVTRDRPTMEEIDQDTLHYIEDMNNLDMALYSYIETIFKEKWEEYGLTANLLLQKYKLKNLIGRNLLSLNYKEGF